MDCQVHFVKSYFEISQPTIANTYVGELHHVYRNLYVYCAVCLIYILKLSLCVFLCMYFFIHVWFHFTSRLPAKVVFLHSSLPTFSWDAQLSPVLVQFICAESQNVERPKKRRWVTLLDGISNEVDVTLEAAFTGRDHKVSYWWLLVTCFPLIGRWSWWISSGREAQEVIFSHLPLRLEGA